LTSKLVVTVSLGLASKRTGGRRHGTHVEI
jgi:hypothetical protein